MKKKPPEGALLNSECTDDTYDIVHWLPIPAPLQPEENCIKQLSINHIFM